MNKTLAFGILLLTSLLSFKSIAQTEVKEVAIIGSKSPTQSLVAKEVIITGKVIDKETGQPLEYATIVFFSKAENKIITGGITDANGDFNIPVDTGTYDITIEFISFKTITIANKNINESQNIGSFSLEIDAEALGEVEVIAERTTVELKLDKRIYNVGQDLTVRGGTVSDVLDNVPSVSVDVDGTVALRGNQNVTILINGKPSGLVGLNSTDALRQLPADAIERVEVITAPSSRYDAEGTGGILNIILRRSKLQGMNGAVTLNAGTPTTYGVSGNVNYRTGDFNFFNTSSYNYRENPGNGLSERETFNGDQPSTYFNEYRTSDRIQNGFTISNGVEWYINDSASLTASFVLRNSDNENETSNETFQLDENRDLIRRFVRLSPETESDNTFQYSINFDKQFGGNSQHRLTTDFQYENSAEDEFGVITNDDNPSQRLQTLEDQKRILLQTDYVWPIGDDSQFEAGYRGNFYVLDTDYKLENYINDDFVINTGLTNNLIYTEHVNAAYTQYGSKIKDKFSYLLGLRLEETRITVDQVTTGDFSKRNYLGLFPTLNLSYEITEDQSLTLGYNRRISRPRSRFINPFPSQSSPTTQFIGNPALNPSYSNTVDIGYLSEFGKLTLSSSLYYQKATETFNFIQQGTGDYYFPELDFTISENDPSYGGLAAQYDDEVEVLQSTPINLASNTRIGFEFTLTYRPTTKWNLNGNFNLFQSQNRGDYNGTNFDADNISWFARINSKYTLPGDIDWQTRFFYRGPSEDAQNKRRGMASVDLAFSKDIFDSNASIAFNISDVFNSRVMISETTTPTFQTYGENQWRQRSFNVAFTYRFNQQKREQNRERRGQEGGGEGGEFDDMQFE
ncbi:TonB-dependent receptor domain-containing protein [Confluentibacter flavum]|uniref:TonB-dependent receptor n=1 Tax=Confluentibacter flavum TaxID=1909700 RepID=A0A2N3HH78_9FLAO|nr:TonB-dependent receptor [Confluentibacter flavum]PKQ44158.1 TonB-dependent receptor [Confluentibacter flavum]